MKTTMTLLVALIWSIIAYGQESIECSSAKIVVVPTDIVCKGQYDGRIQITYSATEITQFKLNSLPENKMVHDFSANRTFERLPEGQYRVICKDTTGKLCYKDVTVGGPDLLKIDSVVPNAPSRDKADGSLNIYFNGGTPTYTLTICKSTEAKGEEHPIGSAGNYIQNGLASGTYSIFIRDKNGCQSKPIQYELADKGNFGYEIETVEEPSADKPGAYNVRIRDGIKPYTISVTCNGKGGASGSFTQDVYPIKFQTYGSYVITIRDKRNIDRSITHEWVKVDPILSVRIPEPVSPTLDQRKSGVIQVKVLNGTGPYKFTCATTTGEPVTVTSDIPTQEFASLGEERYHIRVVDKFGRSFDTTVPLRCTIMPAAAAKAEYIADRAALKLDIQKYECHRDRIENGQKFLRIGTALVGIIGGIFGATEGSVGTSATAGGVALAGLALDEFLPEKKRKEFDANLDILKEIDALYDAFPISNFVEGIWNSDKAAEYDRIKKEAIAKRAKLEKKHSPNCRPNKIKRKYGK